jgi:hypothetical protein
MNRRGKNGDGGRSVNKTGRLLYHATIEDVAMTLALFAFVNYGEGILAPTLLLVVMILARGFVLSGALLALLSICGLAGHTHDRLVGAACWTRCSRT